MGFWIAPRELRRRAVWWFSVGLVSGLTLAVVMFKIGGL